MSYQKPEKDFGEGPVRKPCEVKVVNQLNRVQYQKTHKIRITLTSRKVKSLEKVCQGMHYSSMLVIELPKPSSTTLRH